MSCHSAHFAFFCIISEHGFIGYSQELLQNNTLPDYSPGESFFSLSSGCSSHSYRYWHSFFIIMLGI